MLEKIKSIFDEKSDRWIVILKWLFIFSCIFLMIYFPFEAKYTVESRDYWTHRTYTEEFYNVKFLILGWSFTIAYFFVGMLTLNVARNLQMIREKLCGKSEAKNQPSLDDVIVDEKLYKLMQKL